MGIYISDSIHGLTRLTEYEKNIIASVGFNRLHDVYQNSTVYLTYPSNRTKRFEHSIGTMSLCSRMFFNAVSNSDQDVLELFYDIYKKELDTVIEDIKTKGQYDTIKKGRGWSIPDITLDNFQCSLMPSNVPTQYRMIHEILMQSIRAAALLHDIGHPPYSHVVERAMKGAFSDLKKNYTTATHSYVNTIEQYVGDKKLHEVMGDEISRSILMGILVKGRDSKNPQTIMHEILILESVLKIFAEEGSFAYLHRIIDNSLDGDRLDYVTRDPENSGMNIGSIDYNRIIMDMRILIDKKDGIPYFCVPLKAVNAVEDFLKRRYDLYKNIICHHRVIKTDYLMENMVKSLIKEYCLNHQESTKDEDTIPFDISGLWAPLGITVLAEKDCILSQWNDSWLITVLKKIYYQKYYNTSTIEEPSEYIISKQFAELLNNERNYVTVIKRGEDFKFVDNSLREVIWKSRNELEYKMDELNSYSEKYLNLNQQMKKGCKEQLPNSDAFLEQIKNILKSADPDRGENNQFLLASIIQLWEILSLGNIKKDAQNMIDEICKRELDDVQYLNNIVVFKEISAGVAPERDIYFCDSKGKERYALDDVSSIVRTLKTEDLFRPVFYLYVLVDGDKKVISKKKEKILTDIGTSLGKYIVELILNDLDGLIKQLV